MMTSRVQGYTPQVSHLRQTYSYFLFLQIFFTPGKTDFGKTKAKMVTTDGKITQWGTKIAKPIAKMLKAGAELSIPSTKMAKPRAELSASIAEITKTGSEMSGS